MKHFTQKLRWFLMSLMLCAWVGTAWGQSSGPKIMYDFSGEEFTIDNGAVVNSDKSITMNGAGSANFKFNTGYFMMGKNGAYLTLPTFDFDVAKIVLTGKAGASSSTGMNIYVGEKAVSTATIGCTGTNTYVIASDYQSAGNVYTIKVTSNHNAQITKIEVYEVSSDPGTEIDPNAPGTETNPYTVAQARAAIDAETGVTGVYATGIVSKIVTPYNEKFGNISYNISADGSEEGDQLEAYRGFAQNTIPEGVELNEDNDYLATDVFRVEKKALEAFRALQADLEAEGIIILLDSTYRSVARQEELWSEFEEEYGLEYTQNTVAVPGTSEHHTGLAIDVCIVKDGVVINENDDMIAEREIFAKIHAKLADYGFILRFPEGAKEITGYDYEPWHFRYVGVEAAREIAAQGVTLEEYLGAVPEAEE